MRYVESAIQREMVEWFRFRFPQYKEVLFHPANEGKRNTKVVYGRYGSRVVCTGGAKLKAEGMVAGVADLILLVPRHGYGCLCVEVKSPKGRQSDEQKTWQAACEEAGNLYVVCRSAAQFIDIVEDYLSE